MELNLPNDADGNVIPSNVKVMYEKDGAVIHVDDMIYLIVSKKWCVRSGNVMFNPSKLYLNKPDSLEQLVEDIKRAQYSCERNGDKTGACAYSTFVCDGCKLYHGDGTCSSRMLGDIAVRVERLCGDAE